MESKYERLTKKNQSNFSPWKGKKIIAKKKKHQESCHEFHEICHSVTFNFMKKKDSKRCCDTTMPESIHTKDESKRGSAFAVIFCVN